MASKIKISTSLVVLVCFGIWSVAAKSDKSYQQKSKIAKNQFDLYILATQWMPGWCVVGSGASGAVLDTLNTCQKQNNSPLMYHGLWPENNDGSYPANCYNVEKINKNKLNFTNPFNGYLLNADEFINHEWSKHGTCSNFYTPGMENANPEKYYQQLNNYYEQSLRLTNEIKLKVFPLLVNTKLIRQQIHTLNPRIPTTSILVICDADQYQQKYLTGLWFCLDKPHDHYIPCPPNVMKLSCSGELLTR